MSQFQSRRELFDLPDGITYLDGNSLGPLPKAAAERARQTIADQWGPMLITGWNKDQVFEHLDFVGQLEQTLANIAAIVTAAGGEVTDIVRLTWFITDKKEYVARLSEVGAAYRKIMGRHFPSMSVIVVAGLIEDEAMVEIEATAEIGKSKKGA